MSSNAKEVKQSIENWLLVSPARNFHNRLHFVGFILHLQQQDCSHTAQETQRKNVSKFPHVSHPSALNNRTIKSFTHINHTNSNHWPPPWEFHQWLNDPKSAANTSNMQFNVQPCNRAGSWTALDLEDIKSDKLKLNKKTQLAADMLLNRMTFMSMSGRQVLQKKLRGISLQEYLWHTNEPLEILLNHFTVEQKTSANLAFRRFLTNGIKQVFQSAFRCVREMLYSQLASRKNSASHWTQQCNSQLPTSWDVRDQLWGNE